MGVAMEIAHEDPLCLPASPPQGGRKASSQLFARDFLTRVPHGKPLPLVGRGWGGVFANNHPSLVGEMPGRAEGGKPHPLRTEAYT